MVEFDVPRQLQNGVFSCRVKISDITFLLQFLEKYDQISLWDRRQETRFDANKTSFIITPNKIGNMTTSENSDKATSVGSCVHYVIIFPMKSLFKEASRNTKPSLHNFSENFFF